MESRETEDGYAPVFSERAADEWDRLKALAAQWRADSERVVFANGCFDGLHGGHVSYLEDSAAQGDRLVIGLNGDDSVQRLKGAGRPIMPAGERAELLRSLEWTDAVAIFEEDDCGNLLRLLRPNVHAKGTDYSAETVPEREVARELGVEVYIAGPEKENSTKLLIKRAQTE